MAAEATKRVPAINGSQKLAFVLTMLSGIALAISGFVLGWMFDSNAKLAILELEVRSLSRQIEHMSADTSADQNQNSTLEKHWRLHSWTRDQINCIRHEQGAPPVSWPDLGG